MAGCTGVGRYGAGDGATAWACRQIGRRPRLSVTTPSRWVSRKRRVPLWATHVGLVVLVAAHGKSLRAGVTAAELWTTLIASKVFSQLHPSDFADLLRTLGRHDLIVQDSSGILLAGTLGEKLINQYDFYSAFTTSDEFRISADGRILGSLPIERPLTPGQRIIFGGRRWKVLDVDTLGKGIYVASDRGGSPPTFDGLGGIVHDRIRQEMRRVLCEETPVSFVDQQGSTFLAEARDWFHMADLAKKRLLPDGNSILILG